MDPFIYETSSAILTESFCEDLISRFETDNRKHPGMIGRGKVSTINKCTMLSLSHECNDEYMKEEMILHDALMTMVKQYEEHCTHHCKRKFTYDRKQARISGFQLQRTHPGEYYHWHSDEQDSRQLTYIFYLNSLDDGHTEFYNGERILPKQGYGLVFPATWTYIHRGVSPTHQTKYIIIGTWSSHTKPHRTL